MTTCLGKSCSFCFTACTFRILLSIYVFGFLGHLIVSVPDHCLSFYFTSLVRMLYPMKIMIFYVNILSPVCNLKIKS